MSKKVLLFDDGKIVNLALMKISTHYKSQEYEVIVDNFNKPSKQAADKVFCSVVFSRNRCKAEKLKALYSQIQYGGTGMDDYTSDPPVITRLPVEIEACKPDYDLYGVDDIYPRIKGIMTQETKRRKAQEIVDAGIGFTSRGCVRDCGFCVVKKKEGKLRQDTEIKDLINPKSNRIILLDNNFTADPSCLKKLKEIKERGLVVDLSQGIDVRLVSDEIAQALAEVKMLRSIHYAWDLLKFEKQVISGIETLSHFIKKWRHMCFCLVGYDTTFEEDMYRFRKLTELGVDPYIMVYNQLPDIRLRHFARWVNSRIYKSCSFAEYAPWAKYRRETEGLLFCGDSTELTAHKANADEIRSVRKLKKPTFIENTAKTKSPATPNRKFNLGIEYNPVLANLQVI